MPDAFPLADDWAADGGLRLYSTETVKAPVWLGPGTSPWYVAAMWYYPGDVANRIKTGEHEFLGNEVLGGTVDPAWLAANHEDQSSGEQNNSRCLAALNSIAVPLDTGDPYWGPAVTLAWAAKIVDSDATRQSSWAAVTGVTVDGGHNGWWTAGAGGGSITRALQTRYFVRCNYVQGHVPEGGWWNGDFVLWLKANAIPDLDDLPAAVTACPTEDVTNYDNSGFLVAAFSEWPEAAEGLAVDLTIGYSTIDRKSVV